MGMCCEPPRECVQCPPRKKKPPIKIKGVGTNLWRAQAAMDVLRLATQASALACVGAGSLALSYIFTPRIHDSVREHTELVQHFPVLAASISRLVVLGDDEGMRRLLEAVDRLVALDCKHGRDAASQWRIARITTEILETARQMCRDAPCLKSDEAYRNVVLCLDDAIPAIERNLEDVLYNHLLAR